MFEKEFKNISTYNIHILNLNFFSKSTNFILVFFTAFLNIKNLSPASCLPWIPEKGTVGASGDLAPLSHLAHGMMGRGKMWSPESGMADAAMVLEAHGVEPIVLGPKEGQTLLKLKQ